MSDCVGQGFLTHVAPGHHVSAGTDHGGLHEGAPPVAATAHAVLHHGQQGLLQLVGHGAVHWDRGQTGRTLLAEVAAFLSVASNSLSKRCVGQDRQGHGHVTVEVAPAGEVAGRPVGEDLSGRRQTSHANAVAHDGALIQLQQSQIVSEEHKPAVLRFSPVQEMKTGASINKTNLSDLRRCGEEASLHNFLSYLLPFNELLF